MCASGNARSVKPRKQPSGEHSEKSTSRRNHVEILSGFNTSDIVITKKLNSF